MVSFLIFSSSNLLEVIPSSFSVVPFVIKLVDSTSAGGIVRTLFKSINSVFSSGVSVTKLSVFIVSELTINELVVSTGFMVVTSSLSVVVESSPLSTVSELKKDFSEWIEKIFRKR